jgi:Fe-S cluster assembly protein SufD
MNIALPQTPAESVLGLSLPHRKMEDWRWSDLRQLIARPYPPRLAVAASNADITRLLKQAPFAAIAARRAVFVNGKYHAGLSKLENGRAESRITADEPVLEMNTAFAGGGATLSLDGSVDVPIELVFVTTAGEPRAIATRNIIEIAPGAAVTLIETHIGEGDYLTNSVTEVRLGSGARLDRVKVQSEAAEAVHLAHAHVTLGERASLRDFTLTAGARLNRQNGTYVFAGEHADARVSGSYLLNRKQHADTRLVVDHAVPHCTSREMFKCVLDENARGIFQGKVIVRPGAQKTDGKQSSHGLLLSGTAEFDAKPELEIFADDVVCGHGATAGDLDHDQLFYLRSRGLPEREAKSMLISAFIAEAFDTIGHDGVRAALASLAEGWLGGRA